ncbi:MAG: helix-turn-helix domain-containing protein [Kouleothrix sp.]|jgi:transcriptional regulator with XRE-family HTH domain|nr:helix-turn-helix domain-containing protein [Kouleothrix sp.]
MATLNERLADIVKRKRQRDRFTQSDLGARIGTSGSYISAIESASTSPRISEIEALASVFRTTAFDMIIEAAKQDAYTFSASNRERDAFLSIYDALSPEHKKQARTYLLFLRELQDRPPEE